MTRPSLVDPDRTALTSRERFRRQMHYQSIDRGIHWEFGYLGETVDRWRQEGLPPEVADRGEGPGSIEAYFGVEQCAGLPLHCHLDPGFEWGFEVLEKKADSEIRKYKDGHIQEEKTSGVHTIPHYIKFPISNRDEWKRYKERLDPKSPGRHQHDWKKIGEMMRAETRPVGLFFGSFLGWVRDWVGFENLAMMAYDDRELVEEMVESICQVMESQLTLALRECQVDYAAGWEDICFRNGPLLGPDLFGAIVIPRVKRVMNLIRRSGCDVIWTDCDGNITHLLPLWLEAGMNCMFPLEVQGGTDPVALRKQYGKRLLLRGGLAKYQFSMTRKEIIAELKRVEHVFEEGGFIPHGDHRIPEDVPYDNYRYYVREKLVMMGWKKYDIDAIWPLRNIK